jgi:hypothetical protein
VCLVEIRKNIFNAEICLDLGGVITSQLDDPSLDLGPDLDNLAFEGGGSALQRGRFGGGWGYSHFA